MSPLTRLLRIKKLKEWDKSRDDFINFYVENPRSKGKVVDKSEVVNVVSRAIDKVINKSEVVNVVSQNKLNLIETAAEIELGRRAWVTVSWLCSIAKHYNDPTFPFVTPKLDFLVMNWGLVASLSFFSFSVLILIACSLYRRYAYICKVRQLEELEKKNQILHQFFEKLEKEDQILHQFFKEKGDIKWSDMDKSQLVELIEGLEKAIEVVEKIG